MVKTYRIHPAIGIARVGNSDEWFLAPESVDDPPLAKYKSSHGVIKRQAVRFRVFEYEDGVPVREVTHNECNDAIVWKVHLTNRKAAFPGRNGTVKNRSRLVIDTGPAAISGLNTDPVPMAGTFQCRANQPIELLLGELSTDGAGRLIVVGGRGVSVSPTFTPIRDDVSNDDWCDDTSDGPVRASVYLQGTGWVEAEGAWVVVAPPDFAPEIPPMASLFDTLYQTTKERFGCDYDSLLAADKISFRRHVYPLLARAARERWVVDLPKTKSYLEPELFAKLKDNSPAFNPVRKEVWTEIQKNAEDPETLESALRSAQEKSVAPVFVKFPLHAWRKKVMVRWIAGDFASDWEKPLESTLPFEIDKAAITSCYGYYFWPGIETARVVKHQGTWRAPFRIDSNVIAPGDITAGLAVPWQADYAICKSGWHAVRPARAFESTAKPKNWSRGAEMAHQMLHDWTRLGFVLREKEGVESFLEKERDLKTVCE